MHVEVWSVLGEMGRLGVSLELSFFDQESWAGQFMPGIFVAWPSKGGSTFQPLVFTSFSQCRSCRGEPFSVLGAVGKWSALLHTSVATSLILCAESV